MNHLAIQCNPTNYEGIWIKVNIGCQWLTIANIYRPPKNVISDFLTELETSLSNVSEFVLVGDFNINQNTANVFSGFLSRNNLVQRVNEPTFFRGQ